MSKILTFYCESLGASIVCTAITASVLVQLCFHSVTEFFIYFFYHFLKKKTLLSLIFGKSENICFTIIGLTVRLAISKITFLCYAPPPQKNISTFQSRYLNFWPQLNISATAVVMFGHVIHQFAGKIKK